MSDHLPAMVSPVGEVVKVIQADDLFAAAGIDDVATAETAQLAEFTDGADHLAAIAREAKATVSAELVRRLDRRGSWTLREAGFTITAPSPAAGSVKYDDEALAAAVAELVEADLIDPEAAIAAIERVQPPPPAPYWKQKPAGIKALLKIPAARDAIEACRVEVEPPKRSAKVARSS